MSVSTDSQVEDIIRDYLRPNPKIHLISLQRIYRNLTGDGIDFAEWDEAIEEFNSLDWDNELFREFAEISKQVAQSGETRRSETYFNLIEPDSITLATIEEEFAENPYNPDADGADQDGFKWERTDNNLIEGQYIYTDIDQELTFSGELRELESDGFIEFRIDPRQDLLVLESTSVVDVQKTRRYFGRKTNLEISVCGPLTTYPDMAVEMVNDFLDSFEEGRRDPDDDEPGLLQIDEVRLHYPEDDDREDEALENISFEGDDIGGHSDVSDRISNGWIIKGFSGPVHYKNVVFTMTIAGTGMMAYAKVEGSTDYGKAADLLEIIRERYMENLRVYNA